MAVTQRYMAALGAHENYTFDHDFEMEETTGLSRRRNPLESIHELREDDDYWGRGSVVVPNSEIALGHPSNDEEYFQ